MTRTFYINFTEPGCWDFCGVLQDTFFCDDDEIGRRTTMQQPTNKRRRGGGGSATARGRRQLGSGEAVAAAR